jgi:hypothetical protein
VIPVIGRCQQKRRVAPQGPRESKALLQMLRMMIGDDKLRYDATKLEYHDIQHHPKSICAATEILEDMGCVRLVSV